MTCLRKGNTQKVHYLKRRRAIDDSIFLIGLGSVQVIQQREDGQEITLSVLKRGELGEMAIFERKPRATAVKAREGLYFVRIQGSGISQGNNQAS